MNSDRQPLLGRELSLTNADVIASDQFEFSAMSPEELENYGIVINVDANGDLTMVSGAQKAAERRAELAGQPPLCNFLQPTAEENIVADTVTALMTKMSERIKADKAEKLKKAQREEAARAKAEIDRMMAREMADEKAEQNKIQREKAANAKAEKDKIRKAIRKEDARKTKMAKKAAAERRRNFGSEIVRAPSTDVSNSGLDSTGLS